MGEVLQSFNYQIKDPMGLHARPAGLMVKAISKAPCNVTLTYKDKVVDAKRLFQIMALGVKTGDTITITATGEQEKETIQNIQEIFKSENL